MVDDGEAEEWTLGLLVRADGVIELWVEGAFVCTFEGDNVACCVGNFVGALELEPMVVSIIAKFNNIA